GALPVISPQSHVQDSTTFHRCYVAGGLPLASPPTRVGGAGREAPHPNHSLRLHWHLPPPTGPVRTPVLLGAPATDYAFRTAKPPTARLLQEPNPPSAPAWIFGGLPTRRSTTARRPHQ